ncbi:MAG: M28 family peptidase [Bacteroidota bacterium]|nr:M28 family peptidase [Bacteroidota bacterium]
MNKLFLTLTALGVVTSACAQQNPTAMKYASIISADLAKQHLSIIASDAYEGRETGKPGADKAAHYIADEFKSLGLQPIVKGSYFLDVPVVQNSFKVNSFSVNGAALTSGTDFTARGGAGTKTIDAKDIVFIGYGISTDSYDDLKGMDLTGKVVMYISNGEPMNDGKSRITGTDKLSDWSGQRSRKRTQLIQSKNPLLMLAVSPTPAALRPGGGGPPRSLPMMVKQDGPTPAVIYTIPQSTADQILKSTGKTIADLKASIDQSGTPQSQFVKADISTSYATEEIPVKAVDVLGYLPGSDPKLKNEVLVISAHYDHIGLMPEGSKDMVNNGADDDGSGTTAIMEIARAFSKAKKDGHGPKRSILFLGNVGEEKGLLGSQYYTDHPVIPLANTITDLNIDMIGRVGTEYIGKADSANYVYVIGSGMLSTDLHNVDEKANKTYTNLILDYKYDDLNDPNSFYTRSDHYNFAKHGVPIIFYFNGVHADYHKPGDEVSKINFPLLAKRAQLVYYTAWDLLNADKRPVVDGKK